MKKKIIIISAIAIGVAAAIIASVILLVSLFSASKNTDLSSESSLVESSAAVDVDTSDKTDSKPTESKDNTQSSDNQEKDKSGIAKVTVGTVSGSKGDIVKVPVKMSGNPGFVAALMSFKYDTSAVKYIGYEKGTFLTDYEFADNNGVLKFLCLENKDVKKNGLLFNIKFEILKDSAESDIKLDIEDIVNYDEESIKFQAESGKIKKK